MSVRGRVEVEHLAEVGDGLVLVARIVEVELGAHAAVRRSERGHPRAVREPQRAPVRRDVLDAGHGAKLEERERRAASNGARPVRTWVTRRAATPAASPTPPPRALTPAPPPRPSPSSPPLAARGPPR